MRVNGWTETQHNILQLLSDGKAHHRDELQKLVPDELASRKALTAHLVKIRKVLRLRGQDIICEFANKTIHYRHVQLLAQDE